MLGSSANRGAPKAVKETKGLVSQAVTKALQPSFFFAMFEQDVEEDPCSSCSKAATLQHKIPLP